MADTTNEQLELMGAIVGSSEGEQDDVTYHKTRLRRSRHSWHQQHITRSVQRKKGGTNKCKK